MKHILVRYSEIALKGRNRRAFTNRLAQNIKLALTPKFANFKIRIKHDCLVIVIDVEPHGFTAVAPFHAGSAVGRNPVPYAHSSPPLQAGRSGTRVKKRAELALKSVANVFGVANVALATCAKTNLTQIVAAALKFKDDFSAVSSFRIETTRSDKKFPQNSIEVNNVVGNAMVGKFGLKVNLDNPQRTLYIDIQPDEAFLYTQKFPGPSGLPLGSSGKGLVLLSGGIDSAVAAWKMMRRGLMCEFLHFHALSTQAKFGRIPPTKIVKKLYEKQGIHTRLYLVPYYPFQLAVLEANTRYELVVFRRFMLKLGQEIARKNLLQIIVTGDSLGQVASQTLPNLISTDNATQMLVARPLIGENKQDIIELAKKIGTYKLSIEDYKDCCSIIDRHPATRSTIKKVEAIEEQFDFDKVMEKTFQEMVTLEI